MSEEAEHTENEHEEPTIELEIEHDYKEYESNKDLPNEQSDRRRIHQSVLIVDRLRANTKGICGDLSVLYVETSGLKFKASVSEEAEHTENEHEEPTIELEIEHDYKEYESNKDLPNEQSDRRRIHQDCPSPVATCSLPNESSGKNMKENMTY
ncbi:hypothetical protein Tco_1320403 [Tanacetum coccineum]